MFRVFATSHFNATQSTIVEPSTPKIIHRAYLQQAAQWFLLILSLVVVFWSKVFRFWMWTQTVAVNWKTPFETCIRAGFMVTRNKSGKFKNSIKILMDVEFYPNVQRVRFVVGIFFFFALNRMSALVDIVCSWLAESWFCLPKQIQFAC